MGMSATQARFLSLTARKSNVEFEGQQINQQRLALSNESANYYSQLCDMSVPTPPSIDDFTKVTYTFNDGAMTNTITSMIAREQGIYSISYLKQWQDDYAIVAAASNLVEKDGDNYSIGHSKLRKLGEYPSTSPVLCNANDVAKFEYLDRNLNEVFKREDGSYYYKDNNGNETDAAIEEDDLIIYIMGENGTLESLVSKDENGSYYKNSVSTDEYLNTLDKKQIAQVLETEKYYANLLNLKTVNVNSAAKGTEGWMVRYVKDSLTGAYKPYFYPISELKDDTHEYDSNLCSVSCFSLGSSTQTEEVINKTARVEKDSSGRYASIIIYNNEEDCKNNENGETFTLTTSTVKDQAAYDDAMNEFHYAQTQYDKAVQDINSKLEIVQQQDKKLELKLKQLDTEENAISNEMEAVKKVISKNVESTFKTFNA